MAYVYFDKDTRKILSITNTQESNKDYIEKPIQEVKDFIDGIKNINNYKFDKDFNFIDTTEKQLDIQDSITKILVNNDADIKITNKNNWKFYLSKNTNFNSNLLFAVTGKNNPNLLIRTMIVSMSLLKSGLEINFKYASEKDLDNIDLWVLNCPISCGITDD